jgi:prepilin signal peptidase PulO-like enzyme (type II secretory pathway)
MVRYDGLLANRVRTTHLQTAYTLLKQTIKKVFPLKFAFLCKKDLRFDPLACIVCHQQMKLQSQQTGFNFLQLKTHHKSLALIKAIRLPLGEVRLWAT